MKDTWNVCVRELRPLLRDPFSLIFSLVQPLVFLGIFGPLLVGQSGQPAGETLRWFVPGVLVMIVLFGSGATGSNLLYDMMSGAHERTLVAPLSRSSLLIGRACKELLPTAVQALIIVLVALPFGYHVTVSGFILGVILLGIFWCGTRCSLLRASAGQQKPRLAVLGSPTNPDLPPADTVRTAHPT